MRRVPWSEIGTVFLDAGNTLVCIDFPYVAGLLAERGVLVEPGTLMRAEAAARPELSRWLGGERSTETEETFRFFLRNVLGRLAPAASRGPDAVAALTDELLPVLRRRGQSDRLWSQVLPGVPEALGRFREMGLQLVVVSNSDGTAERGLEAAGLRGFFDLVFDSAVVGFEKPDPRFFQHALERAGARAERVVHVGDLYHADVTGARAAGVHAVLLDPYDDWHEVDVERARGLLDLAERLAEARER
jgi:HAD superfamily hydrolase (TIGR01509 family)